MTFIILTIGIVIGVWIGLLTASLMVVSKRAENWERNYYEHQNTEAQDQESDHEAPRL